MKARTAAWLGWLLFAVSTVITVAAFVLELLPSREPFRLQDVELFLAAIALSATGALVVSRNPVSLIGWLFVGAGLSGALTEFVESYALVRAAVPGGQWAAWIAQWIFVGPMGGILLILQLLPDGSVLSRRWRLGVWFSCSAFALVAVGSALSPGPLEGYGFQNPLGVEALPAGAIGGIGWLMLLGALVVSTASVILRYRRSTGERRQQLKWVVYGGALLALGWVVSTLLWLPRLEGASDIVFGLGVLAFPLSVTIAILKYRLYEVDLVINRTLVYGLLTALLVGVYVVVAVGLGAGVRSVAGQESNAFVIAASTLAVAALFGPARRRIQGFIDRRFYRRKYDAAQTLETFSARLREQVDLDSLAGELVGVVRDTMQPVHVSLWLRSGPPVPGTDS